MKLEKQLENIEELESSVVGVCYCERGSVWVVESCRTSQPSTVSSLSPSTNIQKCTWYITETGGKHQMSVRSIRSTPTRPRSQINACLACESFTRYDTAASDMKRPSSDAQVNLSLSWASCQTETRDGGSTWRGELFSPQGGSAPSQSCLNGVAKWTETIVS